MATLKIEIDLNELVEDMFCDAEFDHDEYGSSCAPLSSLSEEIKYRVVSDVAKQLKGEISERSLNDAKQIALETAENFLKSELEGILLRKLRSGELSSRFGGFKSFDHMIEDRISRIDVDKIVQRHIESKTKAFVDDMKIRYDNVFAAKIINNLSEQKMLSPEISKILLGE